jgi:MarR family transcriptional regulator, temperature-dependent positive regulator of motility
MPRPKREAPSPFDLLHRVSQIADKLFARRGPTHGLTPRQYSVLKAVTAADGLSQTEIMLAAGTDRSTTAELVHRLVKKDLLARRRTRRDARRYAVRLTPKGREAQADGAPAARAVDQELLAHLTASERAVFLKALQAIVRADTST